VVQLRRQAGYLIVAGCVFVVLMCGCAGEVPTAHAEAPSTGQATTAATVNRNYRPTTRTGRVIVSPVAQDHGQVVMAPDNEDVVSSVIGQAGSQMHLRFSRTACTDPDFSKDPPHACDQGNPLAKDLLIAPYDYGMAFEYPSTLEMWSWNFSVHNNHNNCDPTDLDWRDEWSCNSGAKFWVGDVHDLGGLYVSANDAIDGAGNIIPTSPNTSVVMAADTFTHLSHGSLFFQVRNTGSGGDSFVFQSGPWKHEQTVARIDSSGKGYFNGGTQVGGADFAEDVAVVPAPTKYEPGDVMVISSTANALELSHMPYDTRVAGIYSTKPGILGMPGAATRATKGIPLAVVGIVPCKVSAENGEIGVGDLLVAANTPGYAMKGTDRSLMIGAVLGKALEPIKSGKGTINVLVSLQ
jgi:hypothetical protein